MHITIRKLIANVYIAGCGRIFTSASSPAQEGQMYSPGFLQARDEGEEGRLKISEREARGTVNFSSRQVALLATVISMQMILFGWCYGRGQARSL